MRRGGGGRQLQVAVAQAVRHHDLGADPVVRECKAPRAHGLPLVRPSGAAAIAPPAAAIQAAAGVQLLRLTTRVRCVSIFLDKNRRYIGKSQ
eukprot:COSAG01_NODE_3018_length_6713_cov_20.002570_4_plen_92_part_00